MNIAIVDTNIFIKRKIMPSTYLKIIIPSSVFEEIRDEDTRIYYKNIFYNLEIRDPSVYHKSIVSKLNSDKNLLLSNADIDVVALFLELTEQKFDVWIGKNESQYECLSEDNGVLNALNILGLKNDHKEKKWKFRCNTCFLIFDNQRDFCNGCGYNTLTRVSYYEVNGEVKINLKKNFVFKPKEIKDRKGNLIKSEDQKEYFDLQRERKKNEKILMREMKKLE